MNWYSVFYWLTVADGVKSFFDVASNIFTWLAVITFIVYVICAIGKASTISEKRLSTVEEDKVNPDSRAWEIVRKGAIRVFYPLLALSLITWFGYMATPTKKDCLLIVAGGAVGNFITRDTSAKQLPADVTRYLHLSLKKEIQDLTKEERKEIGVETPKDQFVEKLKTLTKEQIIELLQTDTTVLKK